MTHVERVILREADKTRRLSPEYRKEAVAYCTGYLCALTDTQQINADEDDALHCVMRRAFTTAAADMPINLPPEKGA